MVHHLVDGLSTAWLTRARRNIQDPFNRHKRTPLAIMWQPAGAAPIMYHQQQQQKKGSVATTTMTASKNMIVSWFLMATVVTNVHANDSGTIQRMFPDCDPSTYYENSKNGMDWDRGTVALLLSKTHRQIVPLVDNNGRSIIGAPSTSTSTTAWEALQNVDAGQGRNGMATVNMIFTQTEMDASQKGTGWEPGHLWALKGDIDNPQNTRHEWQAAVSDLHNLRPRHPNLHRDSALQSVYYGNCFDCFVDSPTEEDTMFHNTRAGQRDSENRQRTGTGGALASAEELCLCQQERSLQPPEAARGEIARALLYMDLRYGTPTTASDGLGLFLSDCHPDSPISNEDVDTSRRMGYFSRLVQWHLEYPPTDAERERNDKVCHLYQGNRNPFVDFYEDSWSLLNFEVVEEEECLEVPVEEPAEQEEEEEEDITAGRLEDDDNANNHMCDTLMAGDLNFNMVDAAENSFGVVTLWNLPAGMELFVTNNVWTGGAFDTSEGTVKVRDTTG
jgi:endonuclease I